MNESKKQYSEGIKYENIPRHESKSLEYLLPEWITNLKNYFERTPDEKSCIGFNPYCPPTLVNTENVSR